MKLFKQQSRILLRSIICSILTLSISFIAIIANQNLKSDYIILKILGMPANLAFMFSYFTDDLAFYIICFIELVAFLITYIMIFHFCYVIKKDRNLKH